MACHPRAHHGLNQPQRRGGGVVIRHRVPRLGRLCVRGDARWTGSGISSAASPAWETSSPGEGGATPPRNTQSSPPAPYWARGPRRGPQPQTLGIRFPCVGWLNHPTLIGWGGWRGGAERYPYSRTFRRSYGQMVTLVLFRGRRAALWLRRHDRFLWRVAKAEQISIALVSFGRSGPFTPHRDGWDSMQHGPPSGAQRVVVNTWY